MIIQGAIFDMDGTLVDSLGEWNNIWSKIGEKYLNEPKFMPSESDDTIVRTMLYLEAMEYIRVKYNIPETKENFALFTEKILENFYRSEAKLKDGVVEFLEYLKEKKVKMCVASATKREYVILATQNCKIKNYFEGFISCADVGEGKESPKVFEKALEVLGTPVSETWVFEDSLLAVKTASKRGFPTVGIFDHNNFGHSEMKMVATEYIGEKETLVKLINKIEFGNS